MYVWDEAKRKSNLKKHGLDFRDAHLVYENPDKCTYDASRQDEYRFMDVALAIVKGRLLTLVYTEQDRRNPGDLVPERFSYGAQTI